MLRPGRRQAKIGRADFGHAQALGTLDNIDEVGQPRAVGDDSASGRRSTIPHDLLRMTVIKLFRSSRNGASCSSAFADDLGFGTGGGGGRTTGLGALGDD